jgi:hypothetical protein
MSNIFGLYVSFIMVCYLLEQNSADISYFIIGYANDIICDNDLGLIIDIHF